MVRAELAEQNTIMAGELSCLTDVVKTQSSEMEGNHSPFTELALLIVMKTELATV